MIRSEEMQTFHISCFLGGYVSLHTISLSLLSLRKRSDRFSLLSQGASKELRERIQWSSSSWKRTNRMRESLPLLLLSSS